MSHHRKLNTKPLMSVAALLLAFVALSLTANAPLGGAMGAHAALPLHARDAHTPASSSLVISQVYGGGGGNNTTYCNDFIELFNPTTSSVSLSGKSVQYGSAANNMSSVYALPSVSIPAGGYYLIQTGTGSTGTCTALPTPDTITVINLSATNGKVALVNGTSLLACGSAATRCTTDSNFSPLLIDFVGYGTSTDYEGSGPVVQLTASTSAQRFGSGCIDTESNDEDFQALAPAPRNSSTPLNSCGGGTPTPTSSPGPSNTPGPTSTTVPQSSVLLYMLYYKGYTSAQTDEAVRIVNTGAGAASVGSWSVTGATGSVTLPAGATISANSKIWIANNAISFRTLFGFSPDYEYGADSDPGVPQATATSGFTFVDGGDGLILRNNTGGTVDTLVYKGGSTTTPGWLGSAVQPYLPTGQPDFTEAGQILYRKLDEASGKPVADTNTKDDWAQDNDPTGSASPTPGDREYDDINGKKLLRPGWPLTDPALDDMFFTKHFTDTNVTTQFLVAPDNTYDAVRDLVRSAQTSITIETYEWHNAPLVQEVIDAKNRGVAVSIFLEGNPCCLSPPRPDDDTLWSAQQWEAAGISVYFFSGYPATTDDEYRYNNVHAKIMIVDNLRVLTGSENFALSGMPNDPKGNGTSGNRGAMFITNAPDVVAYTRRLVDTDTAVARYADLVRYPGLGTPPPGYSPTPFADQTGYTVLKPTPLVVTETESIEIVQSPDNALRDIDGLIGLVNRASAGDEVMVEQQYERKYWQVSVTDGPNPRLAAYIRAAQRGANVRILLDSFFDDCGNTHNSATVAYINGLGIPNLQARIGQPSGGEIHNKEVLVRVAGQGIIHATSINGSANSSKNNREYGLQVASNAGYAYFKEVFDYDWNVGFIGPCFGGTPTATPTGTRTPPTATPTAQPLICNVLVNPGFETGNLTPWVTTTPGVTAVADNSTPHTGLYSVSVTHAFTATLGGSQGIQQDIGNIIAGRTYQLQGYVYRPDNNIQSARVRVAWYACTDFSCSQTSTSDVFAGNRGVQGWQFFSGGVTAPAGALAARYRLIFYNENAVSTTIRFDDVAFECDTSATVTPGTATAVATATRTSTVSSSATSTLQPTSNPSVTSTSQPTTNPSVTSTIVATLNPSVTSTSVPTGVASGTATRTSQPTLQPTLNPSTTATMQATFTTIPLLTPTATQQVTGTAVATTQNTSTPLSTPTLQSTAIPTGTAIATATAGTPVPPTACAAQFADIPTDNTFYQSVRCLVCRGIISGYPCGGAGEPCAPYNLPYFRPYVNITRGQIAKIVSNSAGFQEDPGAQVYEDVPPSAPFYAWVNRLSNRGIMGGYTCGSNPNEPCEPGSMPYFRPNAYATRGQLSKIVSNAAGYTDIPPGQIFEDVSPTNAFYIWVQRLASRGVMGGYPCGMIPGEPCVSPDNRPYFRWSASVTRGQASKIVANTFYPDCQTPQR